MAEIPTSWTSAPLGDLLVALESGSRPRGGVKGIASGVPSLGGEHLTYDGGFDFAKIKYVPPDFAAKMSKGHIEPADILVVKDGATTGKTAFVHTEFPYDNAVVNEHVFVCRAVSDLLPEFIFRFLMSKEGQSRILANFQGSAQGGINQSFAPNTLVPVAPFSEQKRIVEKLQALLTHVDACRARLDKIPAILKRFRQSVLAAACSGRLTEEWREARGDGEWEETTLDLRLPQVFDATQSCHTLLEHDGVDHVIESGVALPKGLKSRTPITMSVKVSSELGYQHDGFTE